MKITLLGCGTSTGVPVIGCPCSVCHSSDPKDKRLRASVLIETDQGKRILIDTTPDFRTQALENQIPRVDAVLYTHAHADHLHGIDDLRAFNFVQKEDIPCYSTDKTLDAIKIKFDYIFSGVKPLGGAIPQLTLHEVNPKKQFSLFEKTDEHVTVEPLEAQHGNWWIIGFRVDRVAYLTDCNFVPPETQAKMQGLDVLVIDCLRQKPEHKTHMVFHQTMEVIKNVRPKRAIITHMTHDLSYQGWQKILPQNVEPGYDGLIAEC